MRSPFAAGLGPGGARTLYVLGLIAAVKALALIGIAEAIARGVAGLFDGRLDPTGPVLLGAASVMARALAAWAGQWYATRASIGAKERLRGELADRLLDDPDLEVGAATTLVTRGLDDLDPYYRTVLPAAMGAAVVPLLVGVRILTADWLAALIVVLTVPLIPVFMILIGQHTRDRVDEAAGSLARLADHLVELARGLPVLVGLGRVDEQAAALAGISDDHRRRTLSTLRTAFLSALALELIATISVALVAVTVGVRLVGGDLGLEVGLLVLILAPECYSPLREVGTAFHAAQDGVSALRRAREILDRRVPAQVVQEVDPDAPVVSVRDLRVRFAGRGGAAAELALLEVGAGETVALTGSSGAGKSTVLRALAGRLGASAEDEVSGVLAVAGQVAWLPQHPRTIGDTVLDELRRWSTSADRGVGAVEGGDERIASLVDRVGLAHLVASAPAELSPGELRRLALARTLLRIDAGARIVLLDEPTAHLDDRSAAVVAEIISELRGSVALLLVSHDPRIVALADREVALSAAGACALEPAPVMSAESQLGSAIAPVGIRDAARESASGTGTASRSRAAAGSAAAGSAAWRTLVDLLRPVRGRLVGSVALGTLAALSAASLTAVSGWLIVRAAEQPPIMYLLVAIVGVRFFGLARSVLRYAERLVTHDAVFASIGSLRQRMWSAIASRGTASPALRSSGAALDSLIITADRIRDLVPRVIVPPLVGLATGAAALIATGLLHAPAVPLLAAGAGAALLGAPVIALLAERRAGALEGELRSVVTRRLAALLSAADDLRVNGVDGPARAELGALDARAGVLARRGAGAGGLAGAVVVASLAGVSIGMLALSAPFVAAGQLSVEVVAMLALLPLGLIDTALAVVDAVQQAPELLAAVRRIEPVLEMSARLGGEQRSRIAPEVMSVELEGLAARWPGAEEPAFSGVGARVERGQWLAVTGPSGSGKSTLLSVLLGYLDPAAGRYLLGDPAGRTVDAELVQEAGLRRRIAWCPQDAHVFSSTVRGNLLVGRERGDRPSDEELWAVLRSVGLVSVVGDSDRGLDMRIGSEGAGLSGGERQRLAVARALLARADVLLLDEPSAHLDAPTADTMLGDLRGSLTERAVVLVTHRSDDIRPSDRVLALGGVAVG